ncbi:DUF6366 family protein [Aciduricibacillus chroicocephali]|uniref:DUF6366 family protein n=1 Tax=Aciduricibacillus chroicocephali TaxID=3054939 RepID=A0ABY9KWV2_9BACI|nr:DUF6366 family protein [Bacillaceae bacterium 44XB]
MTDNNESPEETRERLRQQEIRNNPTGNLHDSFHRANSGSLVDLFNGLSWKAAAVLILILIIGTIIMLAFFK